MPVLIHNARILTPFSQQDGAVMVHGDRIMAVGRDVDISRKAKTIDAKNLYLVPGYVDMNLHSGGGRDIMEGTAEAVTAVANAHAIEGATTLLPTTQVAPLAEIEKAIDAIKAACDAPCDATIAGAHLQGPFLSKRFVAPEMHPHLLAPGEVDWQALVERWDEIRMVGISPELPGAIAMAEKLSVAGIFPSISHSEATYDQVLNAVAHGFSDVTNIFGKASTLTASGAFSVPGVTESAMAMDELSVQVVADGQRLPLLMLQLIFRCKGAENIVLVTDADGREVAGEPVTMAMMVRNMVAAGVSLRVALRMATVNPARRIGMEQFKGRIGPGYDADILLLDEALNVRFCMAKGKILRNELDEI